ncbi:class I SAM-dependent methyltransferase [Nocardioides sp. AX2bis]|uniref:class I SAM-dependent methyltransferase n=1 Tax=Nocardioides sp. AX2bis TaxID=2653157 RepID=UPI0012F06570|nr:class I SAM-dependent methyltransferase [Nocardioides sp. AX2bis]VXC26919.1 SAM-dependent methyltransferase [Nocardioides sp. AX2bis]
MNDEQQQPEADPAPGRPARAFGAVADAYDRGRPGYPREAATWLTGTRPLSVLELGAGTGKLTTELVALGHDVHATDPDQDMLSRLSLRLPEVRVTQAPAEELPVPDRSVDVVVGAQCFHWFDLDRALPEIVRVLRPGGHVAMVWNERDERIPWVRRLGRILGGTGQPRDWTTLLSASGLFGFVDETSFGAWQTLDRDRLRDMVLSRSHVRVRDEEERERVLAEALALYDGFGRGWEGLQLPWSARCFRATVAPRRGVDLTAGAQDPADDAPPAEQAGPAQDAVDPPTDDDTGTLLIDFR